VIAIGGEVVSADLFANSQLFHKLWPKVLKAAIADAVVAADSKPGDNSAAREFVGAALKATVTGQDNPSQGQEFSLKSDIVMGAFIRTADGITHLALFTGKLKKAMPQNDQEQNQRIQQQQYENPPPDRSH
jgi:hypothetical protein